jgi:cellulose synthase/poly-beta-1,6-N-acetylglucosamine synthase-like glycosyltransferase
VAIIAAERLSAAAVNVLVGILLFFPFLFVVVDTFFRAFFLVVARYYRGRSRPGICVQSSDLRLLFLVLAHNEQHIIRQTLEQIQLQMADDASASLALLADHCTDDTVALANQSGVKVFIRSDGEAGKGRALSWLSAHFRNELEVYDVVTIVDADTTIPKDFCLNLRTTFSSEDIQVVQSFVEPVNIDGSPLAALAAFSEILSQSIDDAARSFLGWTSPLRGTGMIFRRHVFVRVCPSLQTQVDDIELSLRLVELKIPVVHCPQLRIFDPKSASLLGLARQRGRWLRGQREVWKDWQGKLKSFSGFSAWSLLHALLLKPKVALLVLKIVLIGIFYVLDHRFFLFPYLLVALSLGVDFVYYLTGLRYVSEPRRYLLSFLSTPLFLVMWLAGWFYSVGRQGRWLRARK